MPSYVKFMKDILSRKIRLLEFQTLNLTEESSAILKRKLPQKLKDPGSFTIPCKIGNSIFERALCDLGASINLMPLSILRRLGLGEVRPTTVTLQLVDRSLKHPRGVIEDMLVNVDKFIFPADFIVLDMEEDKEIPIIVTPHSRGSVDYPSTRGIQVDVGLPDATSENRAESPLYGELYPNTSPA